MRAEQNTNITFLVKHVTVRGCYTQTYDKMDMIMYYWKNSTTLCQIMNRKHVKENAWLHIFLTECVLGEIELISTRLSRNICYRIKIAIDFQKSFFKYSLT